MAMLMELRLDKIWYRVLYVQQGKFDAMCHGPLHSINGTECDTRRRIRIQHDRQPKPESQLPSVYESESKVKCQDYCL